MIQHHQLWLFINTIYFQLNGYFVSFVVLVNCFVKPKKQKLWVKVIKNQEEAKL